MYKSKCKVGDRSRGRLNALFSIATTRRCRGERYFFPWIVPLTLDQ